MKEKREETITRHWEIVRNVAADFTEETLGNFPNLLYRVLKSSLRSHPEPQQRPQGLRTHTDATGTHRHKHSSMRTPHTTMIVE